MWKLIEAIKAGTQAALSSTPASQEVTKEMFEPQPWEGDPTRWWDKDMVASIKKMEGDFEAAIWDKDPLRKEVPPSSGPRPLVPPTYLVDSLVHSLATNPQPLVPFSLSYLDPDEVQWTVLVRPITRNRIEVTFDRRNP